MSFCNLRRPLCRFAISAVRSSLIPRPRSCAPIPPPRPEFIATPEVLIQPPSSARRTAWPRSPRPRRLAPRPPPPDAPRRPLSSATPPPPPVLVGLGAYSLHHVGGGSGGGRGTKQLSRLGFSSLTKIPPNLIDEEDGDGVHAPPLRPFRRVVAPQLLGIATTASRVAPLPASTHGSRHLPPPRFFGRRARDRASHCAVVVALASRRFLPSCLPDRRVCQAVAPPHQRAATLALGASRPPPPGQLCCHYQGMPRPR